MLLIFLRSGWKGCKNIYGMHMHVSATCIKCYRRKYYRIPIASASRCDQSSLLLQRSFGQVCVPAGVLFFGPKCHCFSQLRVFKLGKAIPMLCWHLSLNSQKPLCLRNYSTKNQPWICRLALFWYIWAFSCSTSWLKN